MPEPTGPSLRLALLSRRYPPQIGGAETVMGYLARALAGLGARVTVLASAAPGVPAGSIVEPVRGGGHLEVVRLPTPPVRFLGTWAYMRGLRRWLGRNPVDLAYVSMLKHDAYEAVGVGRARGFPVVLRPEGAGATGDLAWQAWGRGGRRIGRRCREADAVVVISPAIRAELLAAGYDPSKLVDLPNGVPVPEPAWTRRPGWREAPRAVFVGRLAPEKGLETLVRAWPIVLRDHPAARLTLLGEGPERPALEAEVARLGLAGSVELPGSSADVSGRLRASDLFVLPSREEGMSIALLEAMALGMPLVASSVRGNRRLVADFKHGRLAPPGDRDVLARTILDQWSTFDRACHMGVQARRRVQQEFSIEAVARRHLDLFSRLVAAARPG